MARNVYITPGDTVSIQVRGLGEVYRVETDWSAEPETIDIIVSERGGGHVDFTSYVLDEHPGDTVVTILDIENDDPAWSTGAIEQAVEEEQLLDILDGRGNITDLLE